MAKRYKRAERSKRVSKNESKNHICYKICRDNLKYEYYLKMVGDSPTIIKVLADHPIESSGCREKDYMMICSGHALVKDFCKRNVNKTPSKLRLKMEQQ